ncbi:MAG: serine hydrolase [Deltaproteobacteria bacterium]|nr:serine hydrolase [Deltaproteobacteria bacterium]
MKLAKPILWKESIVNYFPEKDPIWEKTTPEAAGFDPTLLKEATDFALASETDWSHDVVTSLLKKMAETPPYNEIIGPIKERGGPNGIILRGGRIVAEWGDTYRVDMTFSASKSYLSVCAGLAHDKGLIPDLHAPVKDLVDDGGFEPPHNHKITWQHLLQQTSEWEGTLFGKPDWIDRNRDVTIKGPQTQKGTSRELQEPGTYFEYNDVRVNRAALALLRVWRRPLPEVLREHIMDPIGASDTWEWHGYRNSYITIEGRKMQSVSGGGHWGGGLFISSRDHARFGYLLLRRGNWNGKQLLSKDWIKQATTPCESNPEYGYMFWLNTGRTLSPSVPESSFFARGAGSHVVWIDPDHDLVAVFRWVLKEKIDELCSKILRATR